MRCTRPTSGSPVTTWTARNDLRGATRRLRRRRRFPRPRPARPGLVRARAPAGHRRVADPVGVVHRRRCAGRPGHGGAVPAELAHGGRGARAGYLTPGAPAMAAAGLLLAAAIVLRTGGCLASGLAQARRERREHAAFLAGASRADPALGALILDQDAPAAYCLPGGRHLVVVSAGVLAALQPAQLQAVV